VEAAGIEPISFSPGNTGFPETGNVESNVTGARALDLLVGAWPNLPLADQKEILRIVRRAAGVGQV